jgi:hypothetical protein
MEIGKGKGSPYNRLLSPLGRVEVYLYPFMTSALEMGVEGHQHAAAATNGNNMSEKVLRGLFVSGAFTTEATYYVCQSPLVCLPVR